MILLIFCYRSFQLLIWLVCMKSIFRGRFRFVSIFKKEIIIFFTSEHIGAHLPPCCLGHVGVTTFPSYTLTSLKFELIPAKSKTFQNLRTWSLNPTCSINRHLFFSLSQLLVTKLVSFEVSWTCIAQAYFWALTILYPVLFTQKKNF